MLTIFVGAKKIIAKTAEGCEFLVHPMYVKTNGELKFMQTNPDYSAVEDVEIFVRRRWCPLPLRLRLTPDLKRAIIEFLHRYHAKYTAFCCWNFACLYHEMALENGPPPKNWRKLWQVRWRQWKRVGDIVFLTNREPKRFHAAIYIGWGLYLSVYGVGGDLEVSTLRDMRRDFEINEVLNVVPRR